MRGGLAIIAQQFALPLVFYAFLVARGVRHTLFYGVPAFFGGLALAVVDAEGLTLGIGAAQRDDLHVPDADQLFQAV